MDRTEGVRSRCTVHARASRTGWGGAGEGWTRVADGVWEQPSGVREGHTLGTRGKGKRTGLMLSLGGDAVVISMRQ